MFIRNIILAALVAGASAGRLRIRDVSAPDTIKGVYFMEFEQGVNAIDTVKEYFGNLGVEATIRLSVSNSYTNAVSFAISGEHDQSLISDMPKAIDAFAVRTVSIPAPVSTEGIQEFAPEGFHSLTGVNEARSKLGLTGKGIKVGIIDTGVDYNHAALGGGFGPGKRVAFGYDFVGNAYNGDNGLIVPDNDPLDECAPSAHGTHVAGIVGADPRNITDPTWAASVAFTGVAPDVTLGAYRVFGCEGSTATDIMAQAIYRAADDGCDIMNLSIGGGPTYNDGPAAVAATRVGEKGHFVFASAGNSGRSGSFASGSPGVAPGGMGVAAFDNAETPRPFLGFGSSSFQYGVGSNNGRFPFGQEIEIVVNDLAADETNKQGDGSGPYPVAVPAPNLAGKGLLIRWGDTAVGGGSAARCNWAATYGAAYCILYSDTTELVSIGGSPRIPSLFTSRQLGQQIIAAVKAGQTPKIVVSQDLRLFGVPTAGTVSSFSSPGLDQDLLIKPDIGGIGGLVYSTISKFAQNNPSNPLKTPYDTKSGTSMASPYAAGVAALVLQALGRDRPTFDQLRTILQNSANPQKKFGTDLIDSVAYQGAGLINAFQAVTSKTLVYPSRLALNDTQNINQHYRLTVTNKATTPLTYIVAHQPALMVTPMNAGDDTLQIATTQKYTPDYATVRFYRNNNPVDSLEFTLAPGESRSFRTDFSAPSNAIQGLYPIYSGYITVSVKGEDTKAATVPYAGLVGDWKAAPIFSRSSPSMDAGLRALSTQLGRNGITFSPANATFATGVYSPTNAFQPLTTGATLNLTTGALILPVFSTNSRFGRIEALYRGKAWSTLSPLGIKRQTSMFLFASDSFSLQPDAANAITSAGPASLFFGQGIQRNSVLHATSLPRPTLYRWKGDVITNATEVNAQRVKIPAGQYQIRFTALRHFGRINAPVAGTDFDTVMSPVLNLVY